MSGGAYRDLDKNQLLKRFLGNTGRFGSVIIFTKVGQLLIIPIFWKAMTPAEFGMIGVAQLLTALLAALLELGLFGAVHRLYFEWKKEERGHYVGALWVASLIWAILLCVLLEGVGSRFAGHFIQSIPYDPFLRISLWTGFLTNLSIFPLAIMRIKEHVRAYGWTSVSTFLLQTAFSFWFVLGLHKGAEGYLLASLLSAGIMAGYYVMYILREIRWDFEWKHFTQPLNYILPASPASLLEGVSGILDRFVLEKFASLSVVGVYTLGKQFGGAFNFCNFVMKTSWNPFVINVALHREDGPSVIARFGILYFSLLILPALLISTLSQDFVQLTGREEYFAVYALIPWFVLGYFFQSMGVIFGRGIEISKKTYLLPVVPVVGLAANVITSLLLIPRFGVWGAVAAFLLTGFIREATQVALAVYCYPRPAHFLKMALITVLAFATFFSVKDVETGSEIFDILLKSCLCLMVWAMAVVIAIDQEQRRKAFQRILRSA